MFAFVVPAWVHELSFNKPFIVFMITHSQHCPLCNDPRFIPRSLVPYYRMYYCALIPRIQRILQSTRGRDLLMKLPNDLGSSPNDGLLRDVLDGSSARGALHRMEGRRTDHALAQVSLCLSMSYDGLQIHKHRTKSCWILCVSLLNLPPPLRSQLGVGMFVIAVVPFSHGTAAEEHVLQLLVDELLLLERGLEVDIGDAKFIVRAELVQQIYDTKALQKMVKVQGPGSRSGCALCRCVGGQWRHPLRKIAHLGHRVLLPGDHVLRRIGATSTCCPPSFYFNSGACDAVLKECCKDNKQLSDVYSELCTPGFSCEGRALRDVLAIDNPPFWVHGSNFSFDRYKSVVDFPFVDARSQRQPWQSRLSTSPADPPGDFYSSYSAFSGEWIFGDLPYVNVWQNCTYDAMHCFSNISALVIDIILGVRCNKPEDRLVATVQGVHSNWPHDLKNAPWRILGNVGELERRFDAVILPANFSSFRINNFTKGAFVWGGAATVISTGSASRR